MNEQRWVVVLSPDGAARAVSISIAKALSLHVGEACKTFDTLTYRQAFTRMCAQVDDDMVTDLLNQSLTVSCFDFQATHLLVTALAPVTLFTLNLLRKYRIKTVHWFFEDFRRVRYWSDVVQGYDHFCAIQRGPIELYCATNGTRYHFLPTASNITAIPQGFINANRTHDIAFVGIPSAYRIAALEAFAHAGFSLLIAGSGWKSYRGVLDPFIVRREWTDTLETAKLLSCAKIGVNLSVDAPWDDPEHTHISPRVYDILLSECLLVTEDVPLLADSIQGCTCHTFRSIDAAVSTMRTLIDRYADYLPLCQKNRVTVLASHTYAHRARTLIDLTR